MTYLLTCGQRWLVRFAAREDNRARPVQRVYRLQDGLQTWALLAALRYVVAAHPALRLRLVSSAAGLAQCFSTAPAEVSGVSVQGRTATLRAAYARHVLAEDAARPMDLETQSPLLARLIEVDGDYYLGLCVDHVAADELAFDLLERELATAYEREVDAAAHPAVDVAPYLDYLAAEPRRRAVEPANLEYWAGQLRDAPVTAPRDGGWAAATTATWTIGQDDIRELAHACRTRHSSVTAAAAAAQLLVLRDISAQEDIVLNVPVSNRVLPAEHTWIANLSMLLHIRCRPDSSSSELMESMRDRLLEAMMHRYYDYAALSEIVSDDAITRGGRASWLAGFSYLITRAPSVLGGALFAERLDNQDDDAIQVPRGSFNLTARQSPTGLQMRAEWDSECWPRDAAALREQYLTALAVVSGRR